LELLKQIAPSVTRAAILRDPTNPAGLAYFGAIRATAQLLGMDVNPVRAQMGLHDPRRRSPPVFVRRKLSHCPVSLVAVSCFDGTWS
jgi:hypothetical protein